MGHHNSEKDGKIIHKEKTTKHTKIETEKEELVIATAKDTHGNTVTIRSYNSSGEYFPECKEGTEQFYRGMFPLAADVTYTNGKKLSLATCCYEGVLMADYRVHYTESGEAELRSQDATNVFKEEIKNTLSGKKFTASEATKIEQLVSTANAALSHRESGSLAFPPEMVKQMTEIGKYGHIVTPLAPKKTLDPKFEAQLKSLIPALEVAGFSSLIGNQDEHITHHN